jgi:hypothetical protein
VIDATLLADHLSHRRADGVQQRCGLPDHDVLDDPTRLEDDIEPKSLVDFQLHVDLGGGKALQGRLQRELPWRQPRNLEGPVLAARRRPRKASGLVGDDDRRSRNRQRWVIRP